MDDALRSLVALSALIASACHPGSPPVERAIEPDAAPLRGSNLAADGETPARPDTKDVEDDDAPREGQETSDLDSEPPRSEPPDADFIHVAHHPTVASAHEAFEAPQVTFLDDPLTLPHLDVRVLVEGPEGAWVGTHGGLYFKAPQSDLYVLQPYPTAAFIGVRDISRALDALGRRAVLFEGWVQWVRAGQAPSEAVALDDPTLSAVALSEEALWVGGELGAWRIEEGVPMPIAGIDGPVRDLAVGPDGALWVASGLGVYRVVGDSAEEVIEGDTYALVSLDDGVFSGDAEGVTWTPVSGESMRYVAGLASRDCAEQGERATCTVCVDCVGAHESELCASCGDGLCAGHENGSHCPADCGLPSGDVRALDYQAGRLAIAHPSAVTLLQLDDEKNPSTSEHYTGARWLLNAEVRSVAFMEGALTAATEAGLSQITPSVRRLADDAEQLEALLDTRFWRLGGFIAPEARLDDAREPTTYALEASLRDGMNTQLQVAAWCFAYAATGEARFYDNAKRAMEVLALLVDIPGKDFEGEGKARGFIARSLVRDDEGARFEDKAQAPDWHRVSWTDDHDYYWASDTSSLDLAAHLFGFSLYVDLCAQGASEQSWIAQRVSAMTDRLIDSNFELIDLDGLPTTDGPWPPQRVSASPEGLDACQRDLEDCEAAWYGGAWVKSLQTLSQLLASYHLSGNERFYLAYEALIAEHRYDELAIPHPQTLSLSCPAHRDPRALAVAMLSYPILIRYEADPVRRAYWLDGLEAVMRWEGRARHPLWTALTALVAGDQGDDMVAALTSLREMPRLMQNWPLDNRHRMDMQDWPLDLDGVTQGDRVFPYGEIGPVSLESNLHRTQVTGDALTLASPTIWLLTYYALLYGGALADDVAP